MYNFLNFAPNQRMSVLTFDRWKFVRKILPELPYLFGWLKARFLKMDLKQYGVKFWRLLCKIAVCSFLVLASKISLQIPCNLYLALMYQLPWLSVIETFSAEQYKLNSTTNDKVCLWCGLPESANCCWGKNLGIA